MKFGIKKEFYDEFVTLTRSYGMDPSDIMDFIVNFILLNLRSDIDEEDARVFCASFYQGIICVINKREKYDYD